MFKNTWQSPDLPLLCYLLVFTDLLSADLPCTLLKHVPVLLGGHLTPRSILGRYHSPFPLLPSHSHPLPHLGLGFWPTSSTIPFQEMNDFLNHTSLISNTCRRCFLQHTYRALQLTVSEYRSVYRAVPECRFTMGLPTMRNEGRHILIFVSCCQTDLPLLLHLRLLPLYLFGEVRFLFFCCHEKIFRHDATWRQQRLLVFHYTKSISKLRVR